MAGSKEKEEGELSESQPALPSQEMDCLVSVEESTAELLFAMFLKELAFSEDDGALRKSFLQSFPSDLKRIHDAKGSKNLGKVILYPYGSYYHGIGFKTDPITSFVAIEQPISSGIQKASGDGLDATINTLKLTSMRNMFLLEINDALIKKANQKILEGKYKNVTLTRHGKLSFTYCQNPPEGGESLSQLHCLLDPKSFLPVQYSRLVKFYWILNEMFYPFTQTLVQWARNTTVIEVNPDSKSQDSDGHLKVDHIILLAIFFLVRKRILPSFDYLQKWAESEFIIDDINVAFCENLEKIREKCAELGIGAERFDSTHIMLKRILQLLCEFFLEFASFDFNEHGIAPANGTVFSKNLDKNLYVHGKRKFDANSVICIQDILDRCQNTTRKVEPCCVLKFKIKCNEVAESVFARLWNGEFLNALLTVIDMGVAEQNDEEIATGTALPVADAINVTSNLEALKGTVRVQVPMEYVNLMKHAYGVLGTKDDCEDCILRLFFKILQEFNGIFWEKLVGVQAYHGNTDPVQFPNVRPILSSSIGTQDGIENKVFYFVQSMTSLFCDEADHGCKSNEPMRFYVREDWTKSPSFDFAEEVSKERAHQFVKALLQTDRVFPVRTYAARPGNPKRPDFLFAVMLDMKPEQNNWYLYTYVRFYASLVNREKRDMVYRQFKWFDAMVKEYVTLKIEHFLGKEIVKELREHQRQNVTNRCVPLRPSASSAKWPKKEAENFKINVKAPENVSVKKPIAVASVPSPHPTHQHQPGVGAAMEVSSNEMFQRNPGPRPSVYINPSVYQGNGFGRARSKIRFSLNPTIQSRVGRGRGRGSRGRGRGGNHY